MTKAVASGSPARTGERGGRGARYGEFPPGMHSFAIYNVEQGKKIRWPELEAVCMVEVARLLDRAMRAGV